MAEKIPISAAQLKDAYAVVRGFALAFANGRVYGLEHAVALQSTADAARALQTFHHRYGDLTFAVVGSEFQSEGMPLGPTLSTVTDLAKRLSDLNAQTLTFQVGIIEAEVQAFVQMLFSKDDELKKADGFARLLSASGFSHIQTVNYSYQRVAEDEAVVVKDDAAGSGLEAATAAAINSMLSANTVGTEGRRALEQADLGNKHVISELVKLTAPSASVDSEGPAALTQQTIERLQRMSDTLLDVPANRTQKGRNAIKKIIKNVEADLADRLQRLGADIQAMEVLASRVKELIEDLAIDGLVAQYMKLRVKVAEKEKRLKRHITRAEGSGLEQGELKSRLSAFGLPVAILESLSSGALGGDGGGDGAKAAAASAAKPASSSAVTENFSTTSLTKLLEQLKLAVPGDGTLPHLVEQILVEMDKTLQQAATRAQEQIATLKRITMIPAGRPDNADLSRRQLLILMAELGQEVRQSLTVVLGAISIILGRHLGNISGEQASILEMAAESSRTLNDLIGQMIRIAGMPTSLNPDETVLARIQATADGS